MQTTLLVLSAVFTLAEALPYSLDIIRRKTKPRIVSWFNWSLLTGIATAAALADKQYPSAVLTAVATLETAGVVILGLKYGERKFERFDVICQISAIIGLILWIVFNSPLVAIFATVLIDFLAGLPTYKHAWQKPDEETTSSFVFAALGGAFALAAVHDPHLSGLIYPIYIVLANVVLVTELLLHKPRSS